MIGMFPLDFSAARLADAANPAYKRPGVYAIWLRGECVYVGYSGHVQARLTQHRQKLRKGNHSSGKLQGIYNASPETEMVATLLPHVPGTVRQELAWLETLRPAGNTDICSADFNPAARRNRPLTVKAKDGDA